MAAPRENKAHGGNRNYEKPQNAKGTLLRLLKYMLAFRGQLALIFICIIVSALAGVAGTYFIKPVINNYVVPFIGAQHPELSGFIRLIAVMAGIYVLGIAATYTYQRLMINVSTSVLRQVRVEMYQHMVLLPLKYHDSVTTGELMSRYSNDTDT
ncbi:MAG: ABC transporter ATP-binding protein, partial [Firmicutes bacterium]|nr:ABC transporter ATP-binding protein [Bacillota bacterium]